MKIRSLMLLSLFALLVAGAVYGQTHLITANVPFAFTVAGRSLPAGQYSFTVDIAEENVKVTGAAKGPNVLAPVLTQMASGIHTTATDAHVVFDKIGETYILSEVWYPGIDGVMLNVTKEKHEHRILNVPR